MSLRRCVVAAFMLTTPVWAGAQADISSQYLWQPVRIGGGGWVVGMVIHPLDSTVRYARTDVGSAYRWNNPTNTWIPMRVSNADGSGVQLASETDAPSSYGEDSVAVDPTNTSIVYMVFPSEHSTDIQAPTNCVEIYKSVDGGKNFTPGNMSAAAILGNPNGPKRMDGEKLAVDPGNPAVLYYGSDGQGLWRSLDDGVTWKQFPLSGFTGPPANVEFVNIQFAKGRGTVTVNGYLDRDWTGVGISPRFDFIIIHESGHEWFGNSITALDHADMWIHEGWTTYLESLYVEYRWGKADAIKYLSGYRPKVINMRAIVAERGVNADPTQDQYFKCALMLNTLRSVVNNDTKWWTLLHSFYQRYKYQNIQTEDVVSYFNQNTGINLTPIFNQYLHHPAIPRLELLFGEAPGMVLYKWAADEDDFAMPVRVGTPDHWEIIRPTTKWQSMQSPLRKDDFQVATDLYYVDVNKQ